MYSAGSISQATLQLPETANLHKCNIYRAQISLQGAEIIGS